VPPNAKGQTIADCPRYDPTDDADLLIARPVTVPTDRTAPGYTPVLEAKQIMHITCPDLFSLRTVPSAAALVAMLCERKVRAAGLAPNTLPLDVRGMPMGWDPQAYSCPFQYLDACVASPTAQVRVGLIAKPFETPSI
jgi:hypothetical protein